MIETCKNGRCDLRDQTSDNAKKYIETGKELGYAKFVSKEDNNLYGYIDRGFKINIIKDITYDISIELSDGILSGCISFMFIPYSLMQTLDSDVQDEFKEYSTSI